MIKIESTKIAIVVGGAICLMIVLFNLSTIVQQGWPAFLPTLFFIIGVSLVGPKMYDQIKDIFVGALVGIFLNYIQFFLIGKLAPFMGGLPATLLLVFLIVWFIMIMGDILPIAFNNYTFIYWLLASAMPPSLQTLNGSLLMMGTLLIGGLIFMGIVVGLLRLWKLLPGPIPKDKNSSSNVAG